MFESLWEPEATVRAPNREEPLNVLDPNHEAPLNAHAPEEPAALAVSADDFAAIENRIYRAVELVKQVRQAGATAEGRMAEWEARAVRAEAQVQAQSLMVEQLERELQALRKDRGQVEQLELELQALRKEREQVRQRMERLLKQLDALEL